MAMSASVKAFVAIATLACNSAARGPLNGSALHFSRQFQRSHAAHSARRCLQPYVGDEDVCS
jgi:hypothetical protein